MPFNKDYPEEPEHRQNGRKASKTQAYGEQYLLSDPFALLHHDNWSVTVTNQNNQTLSLTGVYPMAIIIIMTPEQLKQWREKNGYTQQRLADALGIIQVSIARWETGVRKIPSFLHLALRCLELEGGEPLEKGTRKRKRKGG